MILKFAIRGGKFITMEAERPFFEGDLIVEDDKITYAGSSLSEQELEGIDRVIDGSKKLYLPGFVNTHGHAAMSLLRGYGDDLALQVWLEDNVWPMEAKFTAEDVRCGTYLSIAEMIKSGTTCFVDMYDHMDEVAEAVQGSGMRASLTRGAIGLFCSDAELAAKLKEAKQFAKDWNGAADGRIRTMMAPHSPYTCPPKFIEQFVEASQDLNVPLHTHMSETAKEVQQNIDEYGARPVEHLEKCGFFSRPSLVAHAVHLTDQEINILKQHDVHISHNPGSNLKLASGIARVPDMLNAGLLVSLATDGPASNNNLDLLEEVRLAAMLHKGVSGDPTAVNAFEALSMGTWAGAQSLWLDQVGMLKPGMKADFIAMDIDQPQFVPATDYISHVVYSASAHDVVDVWIDGKPIMADRELLTLDIEKIKSEAQRCYEGLLKR